MKNAFFLILSVCSLSGCITIPPPVTSSVPETPQAQRVNQFKQRVEVTVTNVCDIYVDVVENNVTVGRLAVGQSMIAYAQRGLTTGEAYGTVTIKVYDRDNKFLGMDYRPYQYPTSNYDSWKVEKPAWVVDRVQYQYGRAGGCRQPSQY